MYIIILRKSHIKCIHFAGLPTSDTQVEASSHSGRFALKVETINEDTSSSSSSVTSLSLPVLHRILAHSVDPGIQVEVVRLVIVWRSPPSSLIRHPACNDQDSRQPDRGALIGKGEARGAMEASVLRGSRGRKMQPSPPPPGRLVSGALLPDSVGKGGRP